MNNAPVAEDDFSLIDIPETPVAVPIYVLDNDYDSDGDPLTIQSVSSSQNGATVWIDSSGTFLWYLPLTFAGETLSIGAPYLPFSWIEDTRPVEYVPDEEGFEPFEDEFEYTVADPVGLTDIALVQVRNLCTPQWSWDLLDDLDEADEIGIDGKAGYHIEIKQQLGKHCREMKPYPNTQMWQANTTHTMYAAGSLLPALFALHSTWNNPRIIADVANIRTPTPYRQRDELSLEADTHDIFMIIEIVHKRLGLNRDVNNNPLSSKPVLKTGTWWADPEKHALLATRFPSAPGNHNPSDLYLSTYYIFVDKERAFNSAVCGFITWDQFDAIKEKVESVGYYWDGLPGKFEQYQIGEHLWEYSPN